MLTIRINLNPIPISSLKLLLTNFPNTTLMGKCKCVTVERLLYIGCLEQDISTTKLPTAPAVCCFGLISVLKESLVLSGIKKKL